MKNCKPSLKKPGNLKKQKETISQKTKTKHTSGKQQYLVADFIKRS